MIAPLASDEPDAGHDGLCCGRERPPALDLLSDGSEPRIGDALAAEFWRARHLVESERGVLLRVPQDRAHVREGVSHLPLWRGRKLRVPCRVLRRRLCQSGRRGRRGHCELRRVRLVAHGARHDALDLCGVERRRAQALIQGRNGLEDLRLIPSCAAHRTRAFVESFVSRTFEDRLSAAAREHAELRAPRERVEPGARRLGHVDRVRARGELPRIRPAADVRGRRCDDVAALSAHVDAWGEDAGAVAHLDALRDRQVDVPPLRAGERLDGVGNLAEALDELVEALVAAVARVDVDDDAPAAGGDADVGVGPLGPPRADLLCVGRGVEAPARRPRVLPRLRAGAVGRGAGAAARVDGVQGEHAPAELRRVGHRGAPEARELDRGGHCAATAGRAPRRSSRITSARDRPASRLRRSRSSRS